MGLEFLKFKVMQKLHDLHNTWYDPSNIFASVSWLFELHEILNIYLHPLAPLEIYSIGIVDKSYNRQEVIVKSWISTENKSLC